MSKEEVEEELAHLELEESRGFIHLPWGFKIIRDASPAELIYHFKHKEELREKKVR